MVYVNELLITTDLFVWVLIWNLLALYFTLKIFFQIAQEEKNTTNVYNTRKKASQIPKYIKGGGKLVHEVEILCRTHRCIEKDAILASYKCIYRQKGDVYTKI